MPMLEGFLSNVALGTSNFLAYVMLLLVVFFLVFGGAVAYIMWKKRKELTQAAVESPTAAAGPTSGSGPSSG